MMEPLHSAYLWSSRFPPWFPEVDFNGLATRSSDLYPVVRQAQAVHGYRKPLLQILGKPCTAWACLITGYRILDRVAWPLSLELFFLLVDNSGLLCALAKRNLLSVKVKFCRLFCVPELFFCDATAEPHGKIKFRKFVVTKRNELIQNVLSECKLPVYASDQQTFTVWNLQIRYFFQSPWKHYKNLILIIKSA